MAFTANPGQLETLREAVNGYCDDYGIFDHEERQYVAELAAALFDLGALELQDIRHGLESALGKT